MRVETMQQNLYILQGQVRDKNVRLQNQILFQFETVILEVWCDW